MISAISWWLVMQVFALAALPLAWRLFRRLPGRGYALAKALGLLLVSYVLWLGASLHLLPNSVGGILVALLAVAALSAWLGRESLRPAATETGGSSFARWPLVAWLRHNWGLVLTTELLFLLVYVGWAVFRAFSGDINGTEKPMEFAFINGVLNSRFFPPQDPWLSGYAISYYYFGYVMVAVLIRLSGVAPAVGFNLGVASWYALVLVGAFSVTYDLVRLGGRGRVPQSDVGETGSQGRGIRYGLFGALMVGVMGNLEGVAELAYNRQLVPQSWIRWLDIKDLTANPPNGDWTDVFWWWWRASRTIHDRLFDAAGKVINFEVIDEFPFFSFLLGDLHPHVLALPFALLAVALALALLLEAQAWAHETTPARRAREVRRSVEAPMGTDAIHPVGVGEMTRIGRGVAAGWASLGEITGLGAAGILLYACCLGALSFLNTWDFPVYLGLAVLALGIGLAWSRGLTWSVVGQTVAAGVTLGALGILLYLPFYLGFQTQAGGMLPNLFFPTRLSQYFLMFGPFLVVAVFFLVFLTRRMSARREAPARVGMRFAQLVPWVALVPAAFLGLILLAAVTLPPTLSQLVGQMMLANGDVHAAVGDRPIGQVAALILQLRAATPWTYLALAGLISWAAALLWAGCSRCEREAGAEVKARTAEAELLQPITVTAPDLFVVLMIGLALLLTFSVEFIFLKDLFGTRMNTVFKFYYQAWVLLGLAAAFGLSRLAERTTRASLALPGLGLAGLLVLGGLLYPLEATPNKANDFQPQPARTDSCPSVPTLDGLVYLCQNDRGDADAIQWIRANVPPAAVMVEASGGSYSSVGRVSMSTGNPTLLGWDFHERQWRGGAFDKLTAGRTDALQSIYVSARPEDLPGLLARWGVDYVYIGELERQTYHMTDASVTRFDRVLRLVYYKGGVRIYAR
jgi:uncharacterized membrane protein